jgi:hypothetical protein
MKDLSTRLNDSVFSTVILKPHSPFFVQSFTREHFTARKTDVKGGMELTLLLTSPTTSVGFRVAT